MLQKPASLLLSAQVVLFASAVLACLTQTAQPAAAAAAAVAAQEHVGEKVEGATLPAGLPEKQGCCAADHAQQLLLFLGLTTKIGLLWTAQ